MAKKKEVTTLEYADGTVEEIAGSIRDIALDQMADTLTGLGIDPKEINKARQECLKVNSDRPFRDLFQKRMAGMR